MAITPLPTPPSRSAPATFSTLADAFLGALPTFVTEANAQAAALTLNDTTDTSTSSVAIGLGAKTFTVTAGKSFQPGMWLVIADDAAPSTNQMFGSVTSYGTDQLVMNITQRLGSGTKTAWTISQSSAGGIGTLGTKNPPIDADLAIYRDSADSNTLKTSTWAQIKAFLFGSPVLTGAPLAPTPAQGTNSTQIATTEFIQTKIGVYDIHEDTELCSVD